MHDISLSFSQQKFLQWPHSLCLRGEQKREREGTNTTTMPMKYICIMSAEQCNKCSVVSFFFYFCGHSSPFEIINWAIWKALKSDMWLFISALLCSDMSSNSPSLGWGQWKLCEDMTRPDCLSNISVKHVVLLQGWLCLKSEWAPSRTGCPEFCCFFKTNVLIINICLFFS